eukprot:TRINITY_DN27823_c0_g1_i1.p1 TRINITY_DN27823_c0_g1~~TRINITY_DN27823_c0_g1_i1.p1  ORF type:complete len:1156 (+),score=243.13 TRINITY_DN27823_c0_g1_i1:97-3564(+)
MQAMANSPEAVLQNVLERRSGKRQKLVPESGPNAYFEHQVLVSKHTEVNIRRDGDGGASHNLPVRESFGKAQSQFVLPLSSHRTPPPLGPAGAKAGSQSARGPRESAATVQPRMSAKPGLMKGLLRLNKVDHLGIEPEDAVTQEFKELKESVHSGLLKAEKSERKERVKAKLNTVTHLGLWEASEVAKPKYDAFLYEEDPTVKSPRKANSTVRVSLQEAEARTKCLEECFAKSPKTIQAAYELAFQWHVLPELEYDNVTEELSTTAAKLKHHFKEEAKFPQRIRASAVEGTDARDYPTEETEDVSNLWRLGSSHKAEITASIHYLNFVRWLCGLPKVTASLSKLSFCQTIGKALLPRVKSSSFGVTTTISRRFFNPAQTYTSSSATAATGSAFGKKHFLTPTAKELHELFTKGEPVSVLQGEGSLVNSVMQSLSAIHMCRLPATLVDKETSPTQAAKNIAKRVWSAASGHREDPEDDEEDGEGSQMLVRRRPRMRTGPGSRQALPPAMKAMQVFWDLRLGDTTEESEPQHTVTKADQVPSVPEVTVKRGVRMVPANALQEDEKEVRCVHFGLDGIWGDKKGALSFRRCLLSPSLQTFAAARYDDTCVLWTSTDGQFEEEFKDKPPGRGKRKKPVPKSRMSPLDDVAEAPVHTPEAVCYPPRGYVPTGLMEGPQMPWTIMPDSTKFQPTSNTTIQVWRVRIDRDEAGKFLGAVRLQEVEVHGFSVDCSTRGQPFCVIFWPHVKNGFEAGLQLEVQLSGLVGSKEVITYFQEFRAMRRKELDRELISEAAKIRTFFGNIPSLWSETQEQNQEKITLREQIQNKIIDPFTPAGLVQHAKRIAEMPEIEPVSHKETEFTVTSCDLNVVVRCKRAAVLLAELCVKRFAGEATEVVRAAQAQRLNSELFLVRVKIPMPRYRYELRFKVSRYEDPRFLLEHDLTYAISAAPQCPTLLRSIEDHTVHKFGYAALTPEMQVHGISLLAPISYRVTTGQRYFLLFVDKVKALEAAWLSLEFGSAAGDQDQTGSKLFSHRLRNQDPPEKRSKAVDADIDKEEEAIPPEVSNLHHVLQEGLKEQVQDGYGDLHLDLVLHNGEHIQRIREHPDLPGVFEGMAFITDLDVSTKIRLLLRFPRIHSCDFSPRTVAEWVVTRADDPLPSNF